MGDQNPIRTARRKAFREERFGKDAFCLFCGYGCLESLTQETRKWLESKGVSPDCIRRVLEDHHAVSEAHDPNLLITLCLNCHREVTEGLMREGVNMHPEINIRRLTVLRLRASAVHFEHLAVSYRKWANLMENEVQNK
jgi:hypothetical protein